MFLIHYLYHKTASNDFPQTLAYLIWELLWFEIGEENGPGEGEETSGDDGEDERDEEGVVRLGRDLAEVGVGGGAHVDGAGGEEHKVRGRVQHQEEAAPHLREVNWVKCRIYLRIQNFTTRCVDQQATSRNFGLGRSNLTLSDLLVTGDRRTICWDDSHRICFGVAFVATAASRGEVEIAKKPGTRCNP